MWLSSTSHHGCKKWNASHFRAVKPGERPTKTSPFHCKMKWITSGRFWWRRCTNPNPELTLTGRVTSFRLVQRKMSVCDRTCQKDIFYQFRQVQAFTLKCVHAAASEEDFPSLPWCSCFLLSCHAAVPTGSRATSRLSAVSLCSVVYTPLAWDRKQRRGEPWLDLNQ